MEEQFFFHELFNQYRLRSGLDTYSKFGEALAEEGFVYEDSLFSKWKNGDRVPKDRKLLLGMINAFVKKGGIDKLDEANRLLFSVNLRHLDENEIKRMFGDSLVGLKNFQNQYQKYKPIAEPNALHQDLISTLETTRVVSLEEFSDLEQREYWSFQVKCAMAYYYSKITNGVLGVDEIFQENSVDQFEKAKLSNRLYLSGLPII